MENRISQTFSIAALRNGKDGRPGADGQSTVVAYLDNQSDTIPTDSSGIVMAGTSIETHLLLYHGTEQVTTGITAPAAADLKIENVTPTVTEYNGTVTVRWTFAAGAALSELRHTVEISVAYQGKNYGAAFTAAVLRSGKEGEAAAVYQLLLSRSAAVFKRAADGTITPAEILINAGYTKTKGGQTQSFDGTNRDNLWRGGGAPYNIFCRFAGDNWWWMKDAEPAKGYAFPVPSTTGHSEVEFLLSDASGVASIATAAVIDRQTVPIIFDGENGTGIASIIFQRKTTLAFVEPPPTDSDWKAETADDYPTSDKLDKEHRYLWQLKTTAYTDGRTPTREVSLLSQFDTGLQPNLLRDTAFFSDAQLEAWGTHDGQTAKDVYGGHNGFLGAAPSSGNTNILIQVIHKSGEHNTLKPNTWYTFSFYAATATAATGILDTFVYTVDGAPMLQWPVYVDGQCVSALNTTLADGSIYGVEGKRMVRWRVDANYTRHSFTFKTVDTIYAEDTYQVLFRLFATESTDTIVTMPKLEENTMATAWIEHSDERLSEDFQHVLMGRWVASVPSDKATNYLYTNGVRHVVLAKESASGQPTYFRLKQRTTADGYCSQAEPYQDTGHWEKASFLKFLATDLLLADEAEIKFTHTNRILVTKSDGTTVVAGMGGAQDAQETDDRGNVTTVDYPLWVGSSFTGRANAPFRVDENGKLYATGAEVSGKVTADIGRIGGFDIGGYYEEEDGHVSFVESSGCLSNRSKNVFLRFGQGDFVSELGTSDKHSYNDGSGGISIHRYELKTTGINNYTSVFTFYGGNSYTVTYGPSYAGHPTGEWNNVTAINRFHIVYSHPSGANYGYQYAMIGSGHIMQDGVVDGGCFQRITIEHEEKDKDVNLWHPLHFPLHGNRIAVSTPHVGDAIILPTKSEIKSALGADWLRFRDSSHPFTLLLFFWNDCSNRIILSGRNRVEFGEGGEQGKILDDDELPILYYDRRNFYDNGHFFHIEVKSIVSVMLVYDPDSTPDYRAYIVSES